ncbi:heavy-metal-associated domain-containing protein, partial [Klebsiella pneumoniae]
VSPNVVTSVVTVDHEDAGPELIRDMGKTLEEVGFEICAVDTTATIPDEMNRSSTHLEDRSRASHESRRRSSGAHDLWSRLWRGRTPPATPHPGHAAAHMDNCDVCKATAASSAHDDGRRLQDQLADAQDQAGAGQKLATAAATSLVSLDGVAVEDDSREAAVWRATVSVGGMTCASCSNTITEEIKKYPWVSRIVVSLVTNSASVDFKDSNRTNDIVEAIEDLGYDASLDNVVNLTEQSRVSADSRDVEIHVDGIFCHRCPSRIIQTIRNLGSKVELLSEPSRDVPFLKIRYTPDAPRFTIRQILKAIEATDPSLVASIYHPPTLEERSRAIRAKHQRELFWRMMLTHKLAIPTFV